MQVENNEASPLPQAPQRQGSNRKALVIGASLLLIIGVAGGGWAVHRYFPNGEWANIQTEVLPSPSAQQGPIGAAANGGADGNGDGAAQIVPPPVVPTMDSDGLVARIADLEHRLARISLEAQSASGNATRAEGLLVAFAVRRALDRGLPLGYLDPQLRLRFGDAQPNAVKTILETARDPVTIEQLRSELEAITPDLVGGIGHSSSNFWTAVRREFSELFVLRDATSPSTSARERMDRARRYLSAAQVDKAIKEVEALPGAAAAQDWIIEARRYHEARRALDLIETAAILEPRESARRVDTESSSVAILPPLIGADPAANGQANSANPAN